jgi:hypothetical protein
MQGTLLSIYSIMLAIVSLPEFLVAQPATDVRIIYADTSKDRFKICHNDYDGMIMMRWVRASGFDYFDSLDPTWTGTGVARAKRGEGCELPVADQWYWMGFVSTKTNTTHCHLNATLRDPTAATGGACDATTAGKSIWKKLWNDEREFFRKSQDQNFSISHGYGQEYVMTHGDYDLDGKNLGWLIYGMKYWNSNTPLYLDHFAGTIKTNILGESPHLTFKDMYERMIKYEHLGLAI